MSNDATYDMIQAGRKVRTLMVPLTVEPAPSGQKKTVTITGRTLEEAKAKTEAYLQGIAKELSANKTPEYSATVRHGNISGGATPPPQDENPESDRALSGDPELTEYHCPVNRSLGTIGGDGATLTPVDGGRVLESDTERPDYHCPVSRVRGTIGGDK